MTDSTSTPAKQPRQQVIRPQPTHCKRGHDLTLPNAIYTIPGGVRSWCRQCKLATARGRYQVKQAAHLKRAVQNPVVRFIEPVYPPSLMKSWPLTSCNELPSGLTPYVPRNP